MVGGPLSPMSPFVSGNTGCDPNIPATTAPVPPLPRRCTAPKDDRDGDLMLGLNRRMNRSGVWLVLGEPGSGAHWREEAPSCAL
jgi:hypothetical protein